MILMLAGEKGGCGKTTIAVNMATMRQKYNPDLLLIDTDKQSTASYFCARRAESLMPASINNIQLFDSAVRTETNKFKDKYGDIIIDAGGRDSSELRNGLVVAHKVLFPIRPSQFDLWTVDRLSNLVSTAQDFNSDLEAYVVLNLVSTHYKDAEAEKAKELIRDFGNLKLLEARLGDRVVYRKSAIEGLGVVENKDLDPKAVNELKTLYSEIYGEEYV